MTTDDKVYVEESITDFPWVSGFQVCKEVL